ncbi:MAG TPA: chemotaxis protein CheW [Oligoflexus sp.]|uniref:chemotaxis protein CheV n=1 Tax=Oligoflexus sp. TaxID=1971216 RepID=UPI002D57DBD9|nr:chemotaxis protein CheW [Oligoflexus sp.]HYX34640.1 chemotaxis protein CheW [Oligoflexus sp.]
MLNRMKAANLSDLDNNFEVGGNYFELIEFSLQRNLPGGRVIKGNYGVNVVKVREVVHMPRINPLSSSVPGIAGIFELRGIPIPAVNLCMVLGDYSSPISSDQQIIVTEFSQKRAGFIVHSTNRIRRVTWDKVLPPSADSNSSITGMMLIENSEFLFILDLEKIIAGLESKAHGHHSMEALPGLPHGYDHEAQQHQLLNMNRNAPGVLLVDDSNLILTNVSRALHHEGYRVIMAKNGQEALQKLEQSMSSGSPNGPVHAIITDVEMPQMDGITFITRVRKKRDFDGIPIFLHTSLGDSGSKELGEKAGANGYLVKNDVLTIIETLKRHFLLSKITA